MCFLYADCTVRIQKRLSSFRNALRTLPQGQSIGQPLYAAGIRHLHVRQKRRAPHLPEGRDACAIRLVP